MSVYLTYQEVYPSMFEAALVAFKSKTRGIALKILLPLISILKVHREEFLKIKFDIEDNPNKILEMNLDEFYDAMDNVTDQLEYLLKLVESHKSDDEIFFELYDTIDNFLTTVLQTNYSFSLAESKIMHQDNLKDAS